MRIGVGETEAARIIAASEALDAELVSPPDGTGAGTCLRCLTWLRDDDSGTPSDCENCGEVRHALGTGALALSVVSLYRKPSRLRDWLTRYKGRDAEGDAFDEACVDVVRAMLGRFIIEHGQALTETAGGVDAMVVVPSTARQPPHPLEAIVESLDLDVPLWRLLERGPGEMGFRKPDRDGYVVREERLPSRLLVLDDVYTTGSRVNSAAAALAGAGHRVAAVVVLARRINPDYMPEAARMWERATARPFSWRHSPQVRPA